MNILRKVTAIGLGALLLLTPGFITDLIGFACLIPVTRRALAWWALRRFTVVTPGGPGRKPPGACQVQI